MPTNVNANVPIPPPPREVRFRQSYLENRTAAVIASIVVSLLLLAFYVYNHGKRMSLADHGVNAVGHVTDHAVSTGRSTSCSLIVATDTPKETISTNFDVSQSDYDSTKIGAPFPVFYDSTNPFNIQREPITHREATIDGWFWTIVWVLGVGCLALAFRLNLNEEQNQLTRLRDWRSASLSILTVRSTDSKSGNLVVSGSYVDQTGRVLSATDLRVDSAVRVDTSLLVLYDPKTGKVVLVESLRYVELVPSQPPQRNELAVNS